MEMDMKKQVGAMVLCGALLLSSGAAIAQSYGNGGPPRGGPPHGANNGWRGQSWYKTGGRLPSNYRGNRYVVNDWRGNRLPPPRRGYHWVRSDNGDFVMVAITTGIIASIIAANH
jgi:Ni/Co efflux regulator RcnB